MLSDGPLKCREIRIIFKNCVRLNFFNRSKLGGKLIWKVIKGNDYLEQVRYIPKEMKGWDCKADQMLGLEEFGDVNAKDNAWGKRFDDKEYTMFKVETLDGKQSWEYRKEDFVEYLNTLNNDKIPQNQKETMFDRIR